MNHPIDSTILWPLLHQLWSTVCNKNQFNGSTMKDRSDDPSHHERPLNHVLTERLKSDINLSVGT